jgi:hypothetical protein
MNLRLCRAAIVAAVTLASSGCGSSGGNNGSPQVVANAGYDQTVFKGELVTLDGRASRGPADATLVYAWRQVAGPSVALSDDRAAQPSFVAPRATTVLRFTLQVGEGTPSSALDEVIVAVQNRAPYADAGADRVAAMGTVVTLDPHERSDPDGDPLTASWFQRRTVIRSARWCCATGPRA